MALPLCLDSNSIDLHCTVTALHTPGLDMDEEQEI
jgi:hypothetical protein